MFILSDRNYKEMQCEAAGFWPVHVNRGDECAFLIKAPSHVIKAAYRLAPITLSVATATTSIGTVLATVLSIADDPAAPLLILGVARHAEEQLALLQTLHSGETIVVFFDELSRPVARARCSLNPSSRQRAFAQTEAVRDYYVGPWVSTLAEVLDEVEALVDPGRSASRKHSPAITSIALSLSDLESCRISAIGSHERHDFRLDDGDEGSGLEQTTWHLLEGLFGPSIWRSPQIPKGNSTRELTDILSFCEVGQFLFETKAMAVISTEMDRSTDRRASNIVKQVDKGVAQITGAVRMLSAGLPVFSKSGHTVRFPIDIGPLRVGVVMVSELQPSIDWRAVARQLIDAAAGVNAPILVLDLQELRFLVGVSKTPNHLMAHFIRRFKLMGNTGSALIRSRLDGPAPP